MCSSLWLTVNIWVIVIMATLKAAIIGRINFFQLSERNDEELMMTPPSNKHLVSGKRSELGTGQKKLSDKTSKEELPMRYRMMLDAKAPVHDK